MKINKESKRKRKNQLYGIDVHKERQDMGCLWQYLPLEREVFVFVKSLAKKLQQT